MRGRELSRRDFLRFGGGVAAIVVGTDVAGILGNRAYAAAAAASPLTFHITDAIKEMGTHNRENSARCYFWVFKEDRFPAEVPGPTIFVTQGETIDITVINDLDEPHAMVIPGMLDTGEIPPVQDAPNNVFVGQFTATTTGSFLYHDNLNAPVNRVMGLHGAFIVMPAAPVGANKWTPYAAPTPQVQQLFNELGTAAHWPGLAWEEGDPATMTPPFRQYVWICHQASAALFRDVGSLGQGVIMPPAEIVERFTRDAFAPNSHDINLASDIPQFFTPNGQPGHFSHDNPVITPMARVGEPLVIRILNAGLMTHSMHLHANHFYVISVDGVVQGAPVGVGADNATLARPGVIWVDTFTLNPPGAPSSRYDILVPFMRCPDVPNTRGIGRGGAPDPALISLAGTTAWPPEQELDIFIPDAGTALSSVDGVTPVPLRVRQSPLCFPVHDHSEPSQTTQGGNYNTALISGMYFIGDRNIPLPHFHAEDLFAAPGANHGAHPALPPQTFPMDHDLAMMLGLDQTPQVLVYGINQARTACIQGASKDDSLPWIADRPPFPV
ncbi:MAG: hypothetical protein FJ291_01610 [Planctomycetes bacterium]|nr:hypothetical protein [Planctomycetota bacterium]